MTHVMWDGFTHQNTWITDSVPLLRQAVAVPLYGPVPLYSLLQHSSTVVGLSALGWWLRDWYRRTVPWAGAISGKLSKGRKLGILVVISAMSLGGGTMHAFHEYGWPTTLRGAARPLGVFVVTTIAVAGWLFLVYSLWRMRSLKNRTAG